MELSKSFSRRVGAGTLPLLGSDVLPTGLPAIGSAVDNLGIIARCIHPFVADNPVQRVAIFHHYTGAGPAIPVPVTAYCYVRETNSWYRLGSALSCTTDVVTFVDSIAGVLPMTATQPLTNHPGDSTNSLEMCFLAALPVGAPDGTYSFGIAFDASLNGDAANAVEVVASALPSGAATAALQTALTGTIYHATTPTKADTATGPTEVNKRGSAHVVASARHRRRLDLTVLPAGTGIATAVASFAEGPCDAFRTDTDNLIVYAQPPERPLIASQAGADWIGAAGWSRVGNVWTHAAGGGTGDLEITPTGISQIGVGDTYCVVYTLTWSAGTSLTEKLGTGVGSARSSSATFVKLITCAGSGKIIFTPTNDAACSIDVTSVYVIPGSAPLTAGVYEAESAINVVAIAAAATPTTAHTTAKLWGYWLRRAGAVELV